MEINNYLGIDCVIEIKTSSKIRKLLLVYGMCNIFQNLLFSALTPYSYLIKLPDGRSRCTLCEKELSTSNALKHATRMHEPADYYECSLCFKIIRHKLDFRNHLCQYHGLKGRKLVESFGRKVTEQMR